MSELRGLQSRITDIRTTGAEVVAISVDEVADNRRVVEKLGLDFPILSDRDRETITAYGVVHSGGGMDGGDIARPATLLIGSDGRVLWRSLTEDWRVRIRPDTLIEELQRSR